MHLREFLKLGGGMLAVSPFAGIGEEANHAPKNGKGDDSKAIALSELLNCADFERAAQERLSHMAYEYIAGGAGDEITMRWNREALDAIRLNPRVLVDVQPVDTSVTLFGQKHEFPALLAPTAFHRLAHEEGEVATARGANAGKIGFVVSSLSTRRLSDIAPATKQPLWFQLFVLQKERREFVREVLAEAKESGCRAIVVTVDAPVTGSRNRSERARFRLPDEWETPYYPDRTGRKQVGGLPISGALTWSDVEWLRANTKLPVLLKGILNPADAKIALKSGVDGIVVSNHGGRELDTVPASITALPKVVDAVEGRMPVLMDSGIRRGTDILKALAYGAKAVLVGRPYIYGLACGGSDGVSRVIEILRKELEMAMILVGRKNLAEIDRAVVG
jgi:4-hydroxymandelate oxidase